MVQPPARQPALRAGAAGDDDARVITVDAVRTALLELHRRLLDAERRDYERLRGRVSDSEFLDVVVKDPDFSWLGALTTMIVNLDELDAGPETAGVGKELVAQIRNLLTPAAGGGEFNRKYETSLQRNPEVTVAHGAVMRALR